MADSAREAALKALVAALGAGLAHATLIRNEPLPVEVSASGLVLVRDGDPGEPDGLISPLRWSWSHRVDVVARVQAVTAASRDAALDALLQEIDAAIAADPTLGGAVEYAVIGAPAFETEAVDGAAPIKAAAFDIVLDYLSPTPFG